MGRSTIGEFSSNPKPLEPCGNIPIVRFNRAA
jgi:hypothetical protein